MQPVQRRLAAILAADMVRYSQLIGEDEAETRDVLRAHREELIEPEIAERIRHLANWSVHWEVTGPVVRIS